VCGKLRKKKKGKHRGRGNSTASKRTEQVSSVLKEGRKIKSTGIVGNTNEKKGGKKKNSTNVMTNQKIVVISRPLPRNDCLGQNTGWRKSNYSKGKKLISRKKTNKKKNGREGKISRSNELSFR